MEIRLNKYDLSSNTGNPIIGMCEVDINKFAENIVKLHTKGEVSSSSMPPGFAEGIPGSFISLSKSNLIQLKDGSFYTMYEKIQKESKLSHFLSD